MIFKYSIKLYFVLSIITIFVLNSVQASNKKSKNNKKNKDNFYLVIADKGLKEEKKSGHDKREEKEEFIDSIVTEINNLIIGNKDTYDNIKKFEKLEQASSPFTLSKRSVDEDEEEHKLAYVITSLENESIIFSYLSEELVPLVEDLPNIKAVIPDIKLESFASNDNLKKIKSATGWKSSCVRGNTYNHLSLISQGKFNDSKSNASYDTNYYYPSSAGKDINIFILDGGFNFNHKEFDNSVHYVSKTSTSDRITQCLVSIDQDEYVNQYSGYCYNGNEGYHGHIVSDLAGGLTNGVASRANVYGIALKYSNSNDEIYLSSLLKALEYINDNYLDITDPENYDKYVHKTVINMSNGFYYTELQKLTERYKKYLISHIQQLFSEISNKGAVLVAAGGNLSTLADDYAYPCSLDDVICVGSIDNIGINDLFRQTDDIVNNENLPDNEKQNAINYFYDTQNQYIDDKNVTTTKNYRLAYYSNYGEKVDIYAPGFVKTFYLDNNGSEHSEHGSGTSYSTPIVAGIAATIMSELPYYKFNSQEMLKYLKDHGIKNIINDIPKGPNLFVNNGNLLNFSKSNEYDTCGQENQACPKSNELECFQHGCCLK